MYFLDFATNPIYNRNAKFSKVSIIANKKPIGIAVPMGFLVIL